MLVSKKKEEKSEFFVEDIFILSLFDFLSLSLSRDLVVNRIERRRHFIYSTRAFDQREEEEEEEEEEAHRQRKRREMWMSSSSSLSSSVGCRDAFKTAQRVQHNNNNNNNRIRFRRQSRRSLEWALGRRGVARGVVNVDAISSAGEQQQQRRQQQGSAYNKYSSADSPLDVIDVPLELVQIRAYVRWEEAGKPEGMPAEWQAAEFARALDDLRHELIEGTPLNEIRRRYNVMTVNNGKDDVPMKFPREVEEYKREREEMMRKATAMGVSRGEQSQQQQQQQQQQRRRFVTPADVVKTKIENSMTRPIGDKEFTNDSGSVDSFDEAVSFDQENEGAMNTTEASSSAVEYELEEKVQEEEKEHEKEREEQQPHVAESQPVVTVEHHEQHVDPVRRTFDPSSIYDLIPKNNAINDEDASIEKRSDSSTTSSAAAKSFMRRWRRQSDEQSVSGEKNLMCSSKLYPIREGYELLVQVFERSETDSAAMSGERSRKTNRRVKLVTDYPEPLTLHWGVARDEPGQWILPPESTMPENTDVVSETSAETQLKDAGEGCLVDLVATKSVQSTSKSASLQSSSSTVTGGEQPIDQECRRMQNLSIYLPDSDSATESELMGIHFVLRDESGNWFKDSTNGNQNFDALLQGAGGRNAKPTDELTTQIIRAEGEGHWWSLMHRYNLAYQLLHDKIGAKDIDASKAVVRIAKVFVWLRFSQLRQLTWQREYNVKPKELSLSQGKLTYKIAELFCERPELRDIARMCLETVGRGGDESNGIAVRDEILNIMHRNNIKEVTGVFLEEWHQKLHNNTSPDDIVICEAYLAFLRGNSDLNAYWKTLMEGGVTRQVLEGYERPIKSEPTASPHIAKDLIRDFENYLSILKSVHSGADLKFSIEVCCSQRNYLGLSQALQYCRQFTDKVGNEKALLEATIQARHEVRNAGLKQNAHKHDHEKVRELLYLDLALGGVSSRAVQRAELPKDIVEALEFTVLALEDLCLSLPTSCEDLALSLVEMQRVISSRYQSNGDEKTKYFWALRAKATVDRARMAVATYGDSINSSMQLTAESIGDACKCDQWTIAHFSEEVIRGGPAFGLSLALTRLDKMLRQEANLGAWSIISPKEEKVCGRVEFYPTLREVMNESFREPTILVCDKVGGGEEIPRGAVALLTPSSVDVLSHSAVRARNSDVLFATCHDLTVLDSLCAFVNEFASTKSIGSDSSVKIEHASEAEIAKATKMKLEDDPSTQAWFAGDSSSGSSTPTSSKAKIDLKKKTFCGKFSVSLDDFREGVVGAKSRNTRTLRESLESSNLPPWINLPRSFAIPFGTFDYVLEAPMNKDKKEQFIRLIDQIDDSSGDSLEDTLNQVRSCVKSLTPPQDARKELTRVMKASEISPPETDEQWHKAWEALVSVWASKWNERAYVSLRNRGLTHKNLQMAVLVQPVIDADYAFVVHTTSPANNDENELYAEIVKGLGETLVGNYPGRALSFKADKRTPNSPPVITGFPSKNIALSVPKGTLIFRSDSNGEDLEGYAGAGLYESVTTEVETVTHVDYSKDDMVWNDRGTADQIMSKITEAGIAIEKALGCAQDIEGCVKDGKVYIVQTRPQV